jgi:hypothetical protein
MTAAAAGNAAAAVALTLLSGVADATGFLHAAKAWSDGRPVWTEIGAAVAGYAVGLVAYIAVVRFLDALGVTSPEIQVLGWFTVTIVGVAAVQGSLRGWPAADKLVAVVAVTAVGWLVVRHG